MLVDLLAVLGDHWEYSDVWVSSERSLVITDTLDNMQKIQRFHYERLGKYTSNPPLLVI